MAWDVRHEVRRGEPAQAADKNMEYLRSYMERLPTDSHGPLETPEQLSTPQAEYNMLDHVASEDDPKKRMEWQKMLHSVLESDVLSSETKRIAAADATTPTPAQTMYGVWLSVRALHVGHKNTFDDAELEEHLVIEERERLVPSVIDDVMQFRRPEPQAGEDERKALYKAVHDVLERVDMVDELFPSQRQLEAAYPTWAQAPFQQKLAALQAWYNVVRELQAQVQLLHRWTGTLTSSDGELRPTMSPAVPQVESDDDTSAVERIFRESNINEAFEQRTLKRLRMLIEMARETLREYHHMFCDMNLLSLEPDVMPLVRFPMWLAEGALRQRLEYADKLSEPSVVLVESLAEDLRSVLALACRIKKSYVQLTVPEPDIGWNLPVESDEKFDASICSALHFFFRLLLFRLKSTPYFKEVDLLEPEWDFLASAVHVVPGGDVIVAHKMAAMINRIFARIITYFQRELQVPVAAAESKLAQHGRAEPPKTGRLTGGRVPMSVADMTRWIQTVFNNARVRSRRLIGFARRIRTQLETAAEYDLRSLRAAKTQPPLDLNGFLQTLLKADYFLVYTSAFEERGVFLLAEPSLHDKPHVIQDLVFQCVRPRWETLDEDISSAVSETAPPHPQYLLFLTPREPFLWTGRVMTLPLPWIEVDMKEQRLRLVANGVGTHLEQCKQHLAWQFSMYGPGATPSGSHEHASMTHHEETGKERKASNASMYTFPLAPVYERMAHLSLIQHELKLMTKAGYALTDVVVHSVPAIRQQMLRLRPLTLADQALCDELVHACFSIAFDQGSRVLGYIQSMRLHSHLSTALVQLSVEWIAFICDDCVLTERRTFKWAVEALENAMTMTMGENIFLLSEQEFFDLRSKVSSCMALLISHFDVLGARSSAVKEKEEKRAKRGAQGTLKNTASYSQEVMNLLERRMDALSICDKQREDVLRERHVIGRVLDDTRLEDRGLQLLASRGVQMRWQQGRFIGGGTFGTVYLAVNLDTGGLMAVKEIRFQELTSSPNLFKQIHDEMNVMEMLRHPNIVEYYGIEVHREKVYIFEEYCQGGSLTQLLEHGRIEDEIVLQVYALQMLDGLMYLHSQGVVHRDIKPDNILLDHMGVIKFVDFGAAKVLSRRSISTNGTRRSSSFLQPGAVNAQGQSLQGTPMYMAPEVVKGETQGRENAMDIWSLGCVILECAKGTRPWHNLDNEWAIMFHIGMAKQTPALPDESQLSPLGIDFIRQCLTIDPEKRPSAVELRQHAWIQALVEELNAANEEEEEAQRLMDEEESTDHALVDDARLSVPSGTHGPRRSSFSLSSVPGAPDHSHPRYEALVADVQYRREGEQIKAMLEPDDGL